MLSKYLETRVKNKKFLLDLFKLFRKYNLAVVPTDDEGASIVHELTVVTLTDELMYWLETKTTSSNEEEGLELAIDPGADNE